MLDRPMLKRLISILICALTLIAADVSTASGQAAQPPPSPSSQPNLRGYQYFFNFGISYSFGSIFNNIVNP